MNRTHEAIPFYIVLIFFRMGFIARSLALAKKALKVTTATATKRQYEEHKLTNTGRANVLKKAQTARWRTDAKRESGGHEHATAVRKVKARDNGEKVRWRGDFGGRMCWRGRWWPREVDGAGNAPLSFSLVFFFVFRVSFFFLFFFSELCLGPNPFSLSPFLFLYHLFLNVDFLRPGGPILCRFKFYFFFILMSFLLTYICCLLFLTILLSLVFT